VKGYKYKGEYVILEDKDFERASPKKSKMIEITDFVKEDEVDPIYYETPYYLEPERSGARAYSLLYEALEKSGKAAVGSFVLRSREHLCVLRAKDKAIILNRIRFAEEIRDLSELKLPSSKPKPAELKMALSLIDQLTGSFKIDKFKDTYSEELQKLIKAKATGKKTVYPKMKVTHRKSKDLMSQLKASLKKAS
jgi:DNA end-binding protein Ku